MLVWSSLVGAMTLSAGLLLVLEPDPQPSRGPMSLSAEAAADASASLSAASSQAMESLAIDPSRWDGVVIHLSGTEAGSPDAMDRQHRELGFGGNAYHFVITNGDGGEDGRVHATARWDDQADGRHTVGPDADWFNRRTIGICLVGDARGTAATDAQIGALVQLIHQLQRQWRVSADQVYLADAVRRSSGSARRPFPVASFRQQLLSLEGPAVASR